jgi:8-oxo-dGTP pyrophosphatase MutT (NUDIX family)
MKNIEDADLRINNIQARGIVLKDNYVLIMHRIKNGEEYYVFPGGHMRKGEEPLETAIREIEEETTIKVKDMKLAFESSNYIKPKKILKDYFFVGYWDSGEPILSGEESRGNDSNNFYEPMWIPREELLNLKLYPAIAKEWLEYYLDAFLDSWSS